MDKKINPTSGLNMPFGGINFSSFIISGYFVSEENRNYTIQFNDGKKYIIKLSDDGNIPSLELAE